MNPAPNTKHVVRPSILLLFLLIAEAVALGQIGGQYPGGQYPGGQYPGGQNPNSNRLPGAGLPFPGRKKKTSSTSKDTTPEQFTYVNGILRSLDEKQVVLQAEDTRIINVKVSTATKYLKAGEDIKSSELKPGDHLEIEATQDTEGFFHAVNVILAKEGTAAEREKAARAAAVSTQASSANDSDDERPRLRRADSPPPAEAAEPRPEAAPAAAEPPPLEAIVRQPDEPLAPAAPDPDDPGPPKLRRGIPVKRPQTAPREVASAKLPASAPAPAPVEAVAPPVREVEAGPAPPEAKPEDPLIEKAREAAESFSETLPNYICQQFTARFLNTSHITSWAAQDVISAEVIYENGRESYRNLAINGKAVKKNMEELSGAWSTGEFGTLLRDLFSPATAAEFRLRRDSTTIAGMAAAIYDYQVKRENSHWRVQAPSQSVFPAYKGSVWIDKKNGRVLRIEQQARSVPSEFPFDTIETSSDYEYVRIGGTQQFLLPVHSENLMCQRGTNTCSRNTIDFRNYKKYSGESSITFDK